MFEAAVVLDKKGYPIFNHYPLQRSSVALPDSYLLWDVIWANRDELSGIAHSHPGTGFPMPSDTDTSTFAAIEAALGRRLDWWIATINGICLVNWVSTWQGKPGEGSYVTTNIRSEAFPWVRTLRSLSRMEG